MNTKFIEYIYDFKDLAIKSLGIKFERDLIEYKLLNERFKVIQHELEEILNSIESKNYTAEEKLNLIVDNKKIHYSRNSVFNEIFFLQDLVVVYYAIIKFKENRNISLKWLYRVANSNKRNNLAKFLACFFYNFLKSQDYNNEGRFKMALEILEGEYCYSFTEFLNFEIKVGDILQSILVLKVLQVLKLLGLDPNFRHERKVAHYTSIKVANDLLFMKDSRIRINSTEFMNDKTEGTLLNMYLDLPLNTNEQRLNFNFLTSYTFNHNHLNQFRLYGKTNQKEGSGISLVLSTDFFSLINVSLKQKIKELIAFPKQDVETCRTLFRFNKLPIFRCCYLDPKSGYLELAKRSKLSFYKEFKDDGLDVNSINDKWHQYISKIEADEASIRKVLEELKRYVGALTGRSNYKTFKPIDKLLNLVNFLFKHAAFKEEEECRVIYCTEIGDIRINNIFDGNNVIAYTFVNYDIALDNYWRNIYIGPASFQYLTYFKKELYDHNMDNIKVRLSDHPLRS